MGSQQHAVLFQLLLLCSTGLVQVIAGQNTGGGGQQLPAPAGSSSTAEVVSDCPAELILAFLKQRQQLQWPPQALKQGLTCTMELSQLTVALPGTTNACTVLAITNNLLSTLYSWQLVWQPASKALTATEATDAVLLNSTGTGDNTVQLINPASSPSIAAKGGSVDMLVQLGLPPPPPGPDSNVSTPAPARRTGSIKPAVEGVYLNGLQCTRLPLARPAAGPVTDDSLYFDDCGTADWPLNANGTLAGVDGVISMRGWGNLTESGGKADSKNGSALTAGQVAGMIAALRQLSCVSQLCCGLQVVPNSVVSINGSTDVSNSTEPPVVASEGPTPNRSTGGNASQVGADDTLPADITPAKRPDDNTGSTTGLVVGLVVAGVVTGCVGALLAVLLRYSHTKRKAMAEQQKQQAAAQQGLVRHGSGASSDGSGGTARLASLASAEWQQQQQHYTGTASSRPPVPWLRGPLHIGPLPTHRTGAPHLLTAAAASATADMPSAGVWRAGSWQGPDSYTPARAPSQLERSSSSPQPLQRSNTASTGTPHHTGPAPLLVTTSTPNSPSTAHLHLPPTAPSHGSLQGAAAFAPHAAAALAAAAAAAAGSNATVAGSPAAGATGMLSAASSPRDPMASSANYSSLNSTWGSLRRMLGNNRVPAPKSSTLTSATNSSLVLIRHGSNQGPDTGEATLGTLGTGHTLSRSGSAAAPLAAPAASHRDYTGQLTLTHYRPPLQLIQEAAPLSGAAFPAQALRQQQLQLLASTGAATHLGLVSGRGGDGAAVSRRISPILSVLEDTSSATSTDSMTPAAWHLTDRQLLEDTPGWLNIDFASEVRLERKLGEGGFGQVFRARWRDEVIAAKLVPFMSLVAQQHHSMSMSLVSAAVGTPDPTLSAAAGQPPLSQGTGTTTDGSQLGNMRMGVQFSSGSLRAIKVEIRVLSQLSHPNIVAFKGACMAPPHICILEELAEGGSLYSRLYSRSSASKAQQQQRQRQQQQQQALAPGSRSGSTPTPPQRPRKAGAGGSSSKGVLPPPLSVSEVLRIAVDVSRAMVYLHTLQPQVVHRDLKPQNVLLDLQGRAKVCDFGISKMKDASLAGSSTRLQAGTPAYMAPEQFEGCSVTDKVDVFAFGVMLWECFEQQQPWKELSPMQIIYSVGLQKERLQRPSRCPDQLWQLIEACWAQDPRDRPSFADTLQTLEQLQRELGDTQQEAAVEAAAAAAAAATTAGKQLQVGPEQQLQQPQQQQITEAEQEQQLQEQVKSDNSQFIIQPAPQKVPVAAEALTQSAEVPVDQVESQDEIDGLVAVVC